MRLRSEYRVGAELKFLANLDMMHLMERALRRAIIPFALSEGFNPHIKLSMGTVLPVGLWGEKEYFDLELKQDYVIENFVQRMNEVLPEGVKINKCIEISAQTPSLMKMVNAAAYSFIIKPEDLDIRQWIGNLLSSNSLIVKSRGKKKDLDKDLRPGIYKVDMKNREDFAIINVWVSTGEVINVRYDELLDIVIKTGIRNNSIIDIFREGNYIREGTKFFSPLEKVM